MILNTSRNDCWRFCPGPFLVVDIKNLSMKNWLLPISLPWMISCLSRCHKSTYTYIDNVVEVVIDDSADYMYAIKNVTVQRSAARHGNARTATWRTSRNMARTHQEDGCRALRKIRRSFTGKSLPDHPGKSSCALLITLGSDCWRDGIRHQVDHTKTTESIEALEYREQHNLRGGGHFLENHHR